MKRYWFLLVLPVLLLIWWGVDHGGSAPVLHFETVRQARIESMVSTNGKVEPGQWAAARAEIAGVVRSISVHQGQDVHAGQLLVFLDTSASKAELAAALARQQEARTENATLKEGGK